MNHTDISPNKLFLAYAIGCTFGLLQQKKITPEEYLTLRRLAISGHEPPDQIMERCFPKACARIGYPRTFDRVEYFWRTVHKDKNEATPVLSALVEDIQVVHGLHWIRTAHEDAGVLKRAMFENIRQLPMTRGTLVRIHGSVIAEICDE